MKCWKCGNELVPGARFCGVCGADQQAQTPPPQPGWQQPQQPQQGWQQPQQGWQQPQQGWQQSQDWQKTPPPPPPNSGVPGGNDMVLKIFAAVCAVLYGVAAVRGVIGLLGSLFGFFFRFSAVVSLFLGLGLAALNVCMCLILVMFITKRTPENSDGLLILLGIGAAGTVLLQFVNLIFALIFHRYAVQEFVGSFFLTVLGAAITVAGVYAILRFVMGEFPLIDKSSAQLQQEVQETLGSLGRTASEAAQGAKASWDANQQARQTQQQAQWQNQQAQWQGQQPQWQGQPTPPPAGGYAVTRLTTNRSLLSYILLSLVTCGFYSWYFIYTLARDVNTACDGDGRQTAGLLKFILLSLLTCGFYSFFWYYSLGNRLAFNAPRYGLNFQENGTTVLLWMLLGSLLCGVGVFVGLHIIIKNTNTICGAYNHQHGM